MLVGWWKVANLWILLDESFFCCIVLSDDFLSVKGEAIINFWSFSHALCTVNLNRLANNPIYRLVIGILLVLFI